MHVLKEILRIIFGPIRTDFTEAGLTQKEEDYPEDINQPYVPKISFSISPKYWIFLFHYLYQVSYAWTKNQLSTIQADNWTQNQLLTIQIDNCFGYKEATATITDHRITLC